MAKAYTLDSSSRYMCLDINNSAPGRKILVWEDGKLIYELTVHLAEPGMESVRMYADMRPFFGKKLTFTVDGGQGEALYTPVFTDRRAGEGDYSTYLRPAVHFTTRYGWINDPNGLVFADGVYHLFYQHNPAGTRWGNMHWGHATSTDLLHWAEKEEALFPDEHGLMYSGCGYPDRDNILGLKTCDSTPIILYYTAAGGDSRVSRGQLIAQFLAYSTDGGQTVKKYSDTPVVPFLVGGNRDPKVVRAEELNAWIMALYMAEREYRLFISRDLLHWDEFQSITLPSDTECPDFYPLTCAETGERLWVFIGAADEYLVGRLTDSGFSPIGEAVHYRQGGRGSYAAQSFSGMGDKVIRIAWGQMEAPGAEFCGQMLIPAEVTLHRNSDGRYRLATNPIAEFSTLHTADVHETRSVSRECPMRHKLDGSAYDVTVRVGCDASPIACEIYGIPVIIDPQANKIKLPGREIDLAVSPDTSERPHDVRLIVDTISVEVFADRGQVYTAMGIFPDFSKDALVICPTDDGAREDVTLDFSPLRGIWR